MSRKGSRIRGITKSHSDFCQNGFFSKVRVDDRDNRVQRVNVTEKGAGLISDIRREIIRRCDDLLMQNVVTREEFY